MSSWADIVTVACSDLVTMAGLCEFLGRHCYSGLF